MNSKLQLFNNRYFTIAALYDNNGNVIMLISSKTIDTCYLRYLRCHNMFGQVTIEIAVILISGLLL